jgi:hypothetical protein
MIRAAEVLRAIPRVSGKRFHYWRRRGTVKEHGKVLLDNFQPIGHVIVPSVHSLHCLPDGNPNVFGYVFLGKDSAVDLNSPYVLLVEHTVEDIGIGAELDS